MYGRVYSCSRCGAAACDYYCDDCERQYQADLQADYDAGQPRAVSVGRAFGAEVAILVHHKAEHCGCRGSGWHSTEFDSWHECPHHDGPHPEYY